MKNRQIKKKGLAQKEEYFILFLITLIGGILRFSNLGVNPLFSDEAYFGMVVRDNLWSQEQIPHILIWLIAHNPYIQEFYGSLSLFLHTFGIHLVINPDFQLRFPFIILGTLSIPLIYFVVKKNKLFGAIAIAFFPLFVFWSQVARPYSIAGFFCILAWRFKWFYIPALLSQTIFPFAAFNIKHKKKWLIIPIMIALSIFFYMIRPDIHYNGWGGNLLSIFTTSARWWYLILLGIVLYLCDYVIPFMVEMQYEKKVAIPVLIIIILLSIHWDKAIYENKDFTDELRINYSILGYNIGLKGLFPQFDMYWFRQDCKFSDYRGIGHVDFSTEPFNAMWYGGGETKYMNFYTSKIINKRLHDGDTLKLALGKLTISSCKGFIATYLGDKFISSFGFYQGGVCLVKMWADKKDKDAIAWSYY